MDCEITAPRRAARAARLLTLIFTWIFIVLASFMALVQAAEAGPQTSQPGVMQVLHLVGQYEQRFRTGDMTVIAPWVAMLERATQADPDNADLWYALGYVYLAQNAQVMLNGGAVADIMPNMQKGPAALRRALQINPDHAEALAQLGGVQALMGLMMQAPKMTAAGIAQMDRGIAIAPDSVRVRLMRAFAGPNLSDDLRNHANEAEDLEFLIDAAQGSRAGDYMMIMRADLHFESGESADARALYEIVQKAGSPAAAMATSRLTQLARGGVDAAEIKALRASAGAQCTLCHGRD